MASRQRSSWMRDGLSVGSADVSTVQRILSSRAGNDSAETAAEEVDVVATLTGLG